MGTADKCQNGPRETARRRARRGTWSDSRRAAHRTHPSPPLPSRRPPSPPPAPWAPGTPPPTSSTRERNPPLSLSPLAVAGASRSACRYYAPTFRVDYIVLMYSAPPSTCHGVSVLSIQPARRRYRESTLLRQSPEGVGPPGGGSAARGHALTLPGASPDSSLYRTAPLSAPPILLPSLRLCRVRTPTQTQRPSGRTPRGVVHGGDPAAHPTPIRPNAQNPTPIGALQLPTRGRPCRQPNAHRAQRPTPIRLATQHPKNFFRAAPEGRGGEEREERGKGREGEGASEAWRPVEAQERPIRTQRPYEPNAHTNPTPIRTQRPYEPNAHTNPTPIRTQRPYEPNAHTTNPWPVSLHAGGPLVLTSEAHRS